MNLTKKQLSLLNTIRGWSENDVLNYLKNNNLEEFKAFCETKCLNGYTLLSLSEGVIAMWRPKIDAKKFINAIEDLKQNPDKYIINVKPDIPMRPDFLNNNNIRIDNENNKFKLPKDIQAPKSFLYCPKLKMFEITNTFPNPYLNMNMNSKLKIKPDEDVIENIVIENTSVCDLGYCEMSSNEKVIESENPYEELSFDSNDTDRKKSGIFNRIWKQNAAKKEDDLNKKNSMRLTKSKKFSPKCPNENDSENKEVYKKISENSSFQSIVFNSRDRHASAEYSEIELIEEIAENPFDTEKFKIENICDDDNYVKPDIVKNMCENHFNDDNDFERQIINYDLYEKDRASLISDHFYEIAEHNEGIYQKTSMIVEEYLEPRKCVQPSGPDAMDSLAEEMMKLFDANIQTMAVNEAAENLFKDKNSNEQPIISQKPITAKKPVMPKPILSQPSAIENQKPLESLHKWNESLKNGVKRKKDPKMNMSDRPLPVPVENEFYYMEIGRMEAENLLEGQPDGTFILRPSSQSNHAYTVTLMYHGRIYNIGCRKRHDGHLALGFTKATEPHFVTINDLIEYYYNEKLILLVDGKKVGSTVLKRLHP